MPHTFTTRALVTGGAGFLGSHLCDRLLATGARVLCVDNFHSGAERNIAHLLDDPCFELMRHDVAAPLRAEADEIFDYRRQHAVRIKVARIFNTYGPRMRPDDGRVVSNFIVQALTGVPLTIHGDGAQTRSFCYVRDLVEALARLMRAPDDFTGPVNLGNPHEITVRELAELIIDLTGSGSPIQHRALPSDDPRRRRPDIQLAQVRLGWTPRTSLRDGLRATIEYFDGLLAVPHRATALGVL